jgi:predicted AlkP superfamily pyrophosphatase or phosphodiesterase
MFVFTSLIQIVFMCIPMSLASRRADVPLRIYLNSFFIFAPTTISLPLTLFYQVLLVTASKTVASNFANPYSPFFMIALFIGAFLTRLFRKKQFVPPVFHPKPDKRHFKRAILLNIDGLSYYAFSRTKPPFLGELERTYTSVDGGARTVYRALTNPAFASILSGTPPEKHRVLSNNLGQAIKTEALPDFINSRLYGSMHVKHFSRKEWDVTTVSLVKAGFDNADSALLEQVRDDMRAFKDTELWIIDLSQADYAGHSWGTYSGQYKRSILNLDALIGDFFGWLTNEGLMQDSLIIISSDHGMLIEEHSFILSDKEERVPLIFVGSGITKKKITEKVSIIDIAANISYCLNKKYCTDSMGRAFPDMLEG